MFHDGDHVKLIYSDQILTIDPNGYRVLKRDHIRTWYMTSNTTINGAVTTYTGQSFIFYDDYYCIELDGFGRRKGVHYVDQRFPGIPSRIDHVFRYIDGLLYFFKDKRVYRYNEFTGQVEDSSVFKLETTLNIQCQSESILNQLKNLLSTIISKNMVISDD